MDWSSAGGRGVAGLALAGLWVAAAGAAQDLIPTLPYRPFEILREQQVLGGLEAEGMEIQQVKAASATYLHQDRLVEINPISLSILGRPLPVPKGLKQDGLHQPKFRAGAWYQREGASVWRHSRDSGWERVLKTERHFSQFEVTPEGQVLLLWSGLPQVPQRPANPLTELGFCVEGSLHFLTLHEPGEAQPSKRVPFPSGYAQVAGRVGRLSGPQRSLWVERKLLVWQEDLGLIWCYDLDANRVREIEAPWPALSPAFLEAKRAALAALRSRYGHVGLPGEHFPRSLRVYPLDTESLFILYRGWRVPKARVLELQNRLVPNPTGPVSRLEGLVPIAVQEEEPLRFFELRLTEGSVRELALDSLERKALLDRLHAGDEGPRPFWVHFDGTPKDLPRYQAPKDAPPARTGP